MSIKASGNSRFLLAGAVVIVAACFLSYMPVMRAGFIWDDNRYVTENELLHAPDGLCRIWFSTDSPSQYFPLTYTSFRAEYGLWKLNPTGYHVTNIIFHAANALLLWFLLRRLMIPGAWFAAAIFALHPVNVESVAWITERKNVLMVFLALLSLISWVNFAERSHNLRSCRHFYILSVLFYVLALAAKSTACTLPVALVLVLWLKNIPVNWKRWLQVIPYLLLGLASGLLAIWWENHHQGTKSVGLDFSLAERCLIAGHALCFYVGKLFWPAELTFSYPQWKIDSAAAAQYLWPALCFAGALALWYWRKKISKGAIAGVVFFAVTLLPVLGFISLYTFLYTYVADHYQYFADIGIISVFAGVCYRAAIRLNKQGKLAAAMIAVAILITLGTLTYRQCFIYKDTESLWRDTLAKNPDSWMACNNLGIAYNKLGHHKEAMDAFILLLIEKFRIFQSKSTFCPINSVYEGL